jgi:hypothetical protein
MAPIPRLRAYQGSALFSYGFRPFFLLGGFTPAPPFCCGCRSFTGGSR